MKRLFVNIIILIVAVILFCTIGVFGFVWSFISSLFQVRKTNFFKYWGDIVFAINVGIDKLGNVLLGSFLNTFAIKDVENALEVFGTIHRTISQVLAVNEMEENTTRFGDQIINVLESLDPGHMKKAIDNLK